MYIPMETLEIRLRSIYKNNFKILYTLICTQDLTLLLIQ